MITGTFTLFDDESVRKKLTVMTKFEAAMDDSRNTDMFQDEDISAMLELGKTYQITITEITDGPKRTS